MINQRSVTKHCVYVISSSRNDYFAEMTAVSIESLRLSNPDCKITIVVDSASDDTNGLKMAKHLADIVIETSSEYNDQLYRSRHLKIRLRHILDEPFLYLDSDTLVLNDIEDLFQHGYDITAGRDYPTRREKNSPLRAIYGETANIGWSLGTYPYLNSGVFFMSTSKQAYDFADRLITNWHDFRIKLGKPNDQPAFNQTIFDQYNADPLFNLHIFDSVFNAQVSMDSLLGRNARIFHIFSGSFQDRRDTVLHVEAHRLKCEGSIDTATIAKAIDDGHPWVQLDSPRKLVAHRGCIAGASKYIISLLFDGKE